MNTKQFFSVSLFAALFCCGSAFASGGFLPPVHQQAPAVSQVAQHVHANQPHGHFYFGPELGAMAYVVKHDTIANPPAPGTLRNKFSASLAGPSIGLFAGYGYHFSNQFYLAGELDGRYSHVKKTSQFQISTGAVSRIEENVPFQLTASVLPGWQATPATLLYARFGLAVARYRYKSADASVYGVTSDFSKFLYGFVAGFGMESKLCDHGSLRMEYQYTVYHNFNKQSGSTPSFTGTTDSEFSPSSHGLMLSYVYRI